MPISSANSLIVIQRLSKIISFTASMFSSVVKMLERPGPTSPLTSSRSSLNRLYYNSTCVWLIVGSANVIVNISNIFVSARKCMKSLFESMFEDYLMQILTATVPQMFHPLSSILAYAFEHFCRYLTNKCFYCTIQCVNWSALVCIDMSFNIAPQKNSLKALNRTI